MPEPTRTTPDLAFAAHDHAHCAHDALSRAEAVTQASGARMTPVRRRVLEILLEQHKALGAYDVLARLATEGFGNQPPVAYRALEFLVDQGLAHRIQRLNAFTACVHPGEDHAPPAHSTTSRSSTREAQRCPPRVRPNARSIACSVTSSS